MRFGAKEFDAAWKCRHFAPPHDAQYNVEARPLGAALPYPSETCYGTLVEFAYVRLGKPHAAFEVYALMQRIFALARFASAQR